MTLPALLLSLLVAAAPQGSSYAPETGEAQEARYASIVADALDVAAETPLPGLDARRTALVLLAVAHRESAFARDVDAGQCAATDRGRCDRGKAVCLLQVQPRTAAERRELLVDRKACFRAGLAKLRAGRACSEPYAIFAGGSCTPDAIQGGKEIRAYVRRWVGKARAGM